MFDTNTILYVVLAALAFPLLKRFFPNLKLPSLPSTPAIDIGAIVNAIVAELLKKLLPQVQDIVRAELAERNPVQDKSRPTIEAMPDGSYLVKPAKAE